MTFVSIAASFLVRGCLARSRRLLQFLNLRQQRTDTLKVLLVDLELEEKLREVALERRLPLSVLLGNAFAVRLGAGGEQFLQDSATEPSSLVASSTSRGSPLKYASRLSIFLSMTMRSKRSSRVEQLGSRTR
jgi:hypothetical protein